jgi:hypothetical protein
MIRIVLVWTLAATASGAVLVDGGRQVPESDLLRGYAFATCVAAGYRGTALETDALHVAELYREVGHETRQPLYDALTKAARAIEPAKPAKIDGANLALMRCLELYESSALRKLARSRP